MTARVLTLRIANSQLQTGTGGADSYNGMLDCFRKIIRNEGYG